MRNRGLRTFLVAVVAALGCGTAQRTAPPLPAADADARALDDAGHDAGHDGGAVADAVAAHDADAAHPRLPVDAAPLRDAGHDADVDVERSLFVGDSFTYVNDLPATYQGLGAAVAHVAPVVNSVAYGGYTLAQHLADAQGTGPNPELESLLGRGDAARAHWSHVVLQEQSEIPGFDLRNPERAASMASTVTLSGYVAATGATSVLLMTWGYAEGDPANMAFFPDFNTMQWLLAIGYQQMAAAVAAAGHAVVIAPVGLAFQAVYLGATATDAGGDPFAPTSLFMQLYETDLKHPAVPGTYLAACVVAATIYGVDPTTFSTTVPGIDTATVGVLQAAAKESFVMLSQLPPVSDAGIDASADAL